MCLFFFSSRRRHTRFDCDWSSDVCSSDLPASLVKVEPAAPVLSISIAATDRKDDVKLGQALLRLNEEDPSLTMIQNPRTHDRSEERRVGKECRSPWSP